jgi:hypothetical protein
MVYQKGHFIPINPKLSYLGLTRTSARGNRLTLTITVCFLFIYNITAVCTNNYYLITCKY